MTGSAASTSWSTPSASRSSSRSRRSPRRLTTRSTRPTSNPRCSSRRPSPSGRSRRRSGGRQIHLLSVRSQLALRGKGYSAYCSTKGGLVMLVKQHAMELAPHGITVNGVAPTFVNTEMIQHVYARPEFREAILARIPLGPHRRSEGRGRCRALPRLAGRRLCDRPGALCRRRYHGEPIEQAQPSGALTPTLRALRSCESAPETAASRALEAMGGPRKCAGLSPH